MRAKVRLLIPAGLAVAAIMQFALARQRPQQQPPLLGPELGTALPQTVVSVLHAGEDAGERLLLADLLREEGTCSMLVLVDPGCRFSMRMRFTWPAAVRAWKASLGTSIRVVWLSGGTPELLNQFYDGHDFSGIIRARIPSGAAEAFRRLGVPGTPIIYLLDAEGRLRLGINGDSFPPLDSVASACR